MSILKEFSSLLFVVLGILIGYFLMDSTKDSKGMQSLKKSYHSLQDTYGTLLKDQRVLRSRYKEELALKGEIQAEIAALKSKGDSLLSELSSKKALLQALQESQWIQKKHYVVGGETSNTLEPPITGVYRVFFSSSDPKALFWINDKPYKQRVSYEISLVKGEAISVRAESLEIWKIELTPKLENLL